MESNDECSLVHDYLPTNSHNATERSRWGSHMVLGSLKILLGGLHVFFLWGVTKSTRYCGHFWLIVPAPDDRWGWLWSNWWNEDWQGKPRYSEKTCPSATSSTTIPTWPDPGSNPGRRGGKPETNRLSYGAALLSYLLKGYVTLSIFFLFLIPCHFILLRIWVPLIRFPLSHVFVNVCGPLLTCTPAFWVPTCLDISACTSI
jgi:hypothetical protein